MPVQRWFVRKECMLEGQFSAWFERDSQSVCAFLLELIGKSEHGDTNLAEVSYAIMQDAQI